MKGGVKAPSDRAEDHADTATNSPGSNKAAKVGMSPLRFVVDTACYHSVMKETVRVSHICKVPFVPPALICQG